MITADFHNHTSFSSDSTAPMEGQIRQAISLGFTRLCVTDHMDRHYPNPIDKGSFELEPDAYFDSLQTLRARYRGQIELLFGIEFGLRNEPHLKEEILNFYQNLEASYPFDFIIGSTHALHGADPASAEYWESATLKDGLRDYFQSIADNASWYPCFDVYGHLDYIVRYVPAEVKDYCYEDYRERIDQALLAILNAGKGIEVNTAGLKTLSYPHPKKEILMRYRELGGEIVTVGSDAHAPEFLGYQFNRAEEYLKECGFRYYTVFKDRKPIFEKL